jgi:hypothetical protein
MRINAPEYLILLGIGVLNIWAALILASVRSRAKQEAIVPLSIEHPKMEVPRATGTEQRA